MKIYKILLILISIISCSSPKREKLKGKEIETNIVSTKTEQNIKKETVNHLNGLKEKFETFGDSVQIPTFEILINLTNKANRKLKRNKETIIVAAYFRGQPKDTTSQEFLNWGEIFIGKHNIELSDERIAKFENIKIYKPLFEKLKDENFEVLINVYSGRKSSNYNLIDCEILQKPIKEIIGMRKELNGKLL